MAVGRWLWAIASARLLIGELPERGEPSFAQSRNVSSRNIEVTMARDVTDEERARIAEMMAELEFSDDPKVDYRRLRAKLSKSVQRASP